VITPNEINKILSTAEMSMKNSPIGKKRVFAVLLVFALLIPMDVFAQSLFYIPFKPGVFSP
jgi:hypothetical protein